MIVLAFETRDLALLHGDSESTAYLCDFDLNDNCGGVLSANFSGAGYAFTASNQAHIMSSTTITDYSSICKY